MDRKSSYIDRDVPELIEGLVADISEISSIKVFRPKYVPSVQEVIKDVINNQIIDEGLKIREHTGLSFWDSILLYVSKHDRTADTLLKLATRHNSQNLDFTEIGRSDCKESTFRTLFSELRRGQILALSSSIATTQGTIRHLPMIDFHCKESGSNLKLIKTTIAELCLSGYIARSGGSYHFYGRSLVDEQTLVNILARSLLFSPIVDHRWVAHQLIERACGLRISPGKQYSWCPQVIAEV